MCVLCGESVLQVHWTDRKNDDRTTGATGRQGGSGIRERMHRIKLANRILGFYGLILEDWNGSRFILRDKKGRSELVQDLGSLWKKAAKLAVRPLDPLDPSFLQQANANRASLGDKP